VVTGGEFAPIVEEIFCLGEFRSVAREFGFEDAIFDGGFEAEAFIEGGVLHGIAAPGGEIALGIGPGDVVVDIVIADGEELVDGHGGGDEVIFTFGDIEDGFGEFFQELEDAGVFPLVLAKGFVIHEEVAEVAIAVDVVDPLGEFFGREGPLGPTSIGEAEGDVIGEAVVFAEGGEGLVLPPNCRAGIAGSHVGVVGGAEAEDAVDTFAEDAGEAAGSVWVFHVGDEVGEFVVVDEFGVAEDAGCDPEELFDLGRVHVDLLDKLTLGINEGEGVAVGLADELAAAGVGELLEEVDDIGAELLKLFEGDAGDGVGDAEVALVAFDQVEDQFGCWAIALVGDLAGDLAVFEVVEVEMVGIKDRIAAEAEGLVDLKVKDDTCHGERIAEKEG
jgi:hypothetical protein